MKLVYSVKNMMLILEIVQIVILDLNKKKANVFVNDIINTLTMVNQYN